MASATFIPRVPQGKQFITGTCKADADCASSCCGFKSGKCAGAVIAQERDGGCGFGDAQPNNDAAVAIQGPNAEKPGGGAGTAAATAAATGAGASSTATAAGAAGTQFITGECKSDADCASSCCGFKSGKCAGAIIAQTRDGGCGFGDAKPNDKAAKALQARSPRPLSSLE